MTTKHKDASDADDKVKGPAAAPDAGKPSLEGGTDVPSFLEATGGRGVQPPPGVSPDAAPKGKAKRGPAKALTAISHGYLDDKGRNVTVTFNPGDEIPADVVAEIEKSGAREGVSFTRDE